MKWKELLKVQIYYLLFAKKIKLFVDETLVANIYKFLKTVISTNMQSERSFSAELICTKMRSRLQNEILDMVCVWKLYFNIKNDCK